MIRRRPDCEPINALEDGMFTFPFKDFHEFVEYSLWLASLESTGIEGFIDREPN